MSDYRSGNKHRNRAAQQRRRTILITVLLAAAVLAVSLYLLYPQLQTRLAAGKSSGKDSAGTVSAEGAESGGMQNSGMQNSGSAGGEASGTQGEGGPAGNGQAENPLAEEAAHLGETSAAAQGVVSYGGKQYRYNDHLSNYLFLGIDTDGDIQEERASISAGQADAIYLASYDRQTQKLRMLAIPRDTMTAIDLYDKQGDYNGTTTGHLAVQYAYGDGRFTSCERTRDAVSHLLYGVPILGYASMNRSSIPLLADVVDGVPLTVPDDSLAERDDTFRAGAAVTITSANAETFLRYRDTTTHQQALVRMERQKTFIRAFADRLLELQRQDPHTVTDVYEEMKPYMVTNMTNDIFLDLAGASREGGITTIPGEGVATEKYDEYHVDEDALYELILDVFYREV